MGKTKKFCFSTEEFKFALLTVKKKSYQVFFWQAESLWAVTESHCKYYKSKSELFDIVMWPFLAFAEFISSSTYCRHNKPS